MSFYYGGRNYAILLIAMVNINILCGTTEKLRLKAKVCYVIYQKVLSIPKIYFMIGQTLTPFFCRRKVFKF